MTPADPFPHLPQPTWLPTATSLATAALEALVAYGEADAGPDQEPEELTLDITTAGIESVWAGDGRDAPQRDLLATATAHQGISARHRLAAAIGPAEQLRALLRAHLPLLGGQRTAALLSLSVFPRPATAALPARWLAAAPLGHQATNTALAADAQAAGANLAWRLALLSALPQSPTDAFSLAHHSHTWHAPSANAALVLHAACTTSSPEAAYKMLAHHRPDVWAHVPDTDPLSLLGPTAP